MEAPIDGTKNEVDAQRVTSSADVDDDPLALFEAETGDALPVRPSGTSTVAERTTAHGTALVALDDVLRRLGHVAWPEGVAIVHAIGEILNTAGGHPRLPDLANASLRANGTVVITGAAATAPPGPHLAWVLYTLTASGSVPPPLRLLITKWTSYEGSHTIVDFLAELAYFVRADSAALIQAVYERAMAAPPASGQKPQPAPTSPAAQRKEPRPAVRRRDVRRTAAAVLAVASLAGVVAWLADQSTSDISGALPNTISAWLAAGRDGVRSVTGQAGGTVEPPIPPPDVPAPAAVGSGAGARGGAGRPQRSAPGPVTQGDRGAFDAGRQAGQDGVGAPLAFGAPASQGSRGASPPDDLASPAGDEARMIYSSADPDVIPPELRQPQLPPPLLSGHQGNLNTIEVVVSPSGTVERVRLLSAPHRMTDMMLLSGAKAWQFEPASRHGQPVRYRLVFSWGAAP